MKSRWLTILLLALAVSALVISSLGFVAIQSTGPGVEWGMSLLAVICIGLGWWFWYHYLRKQEPVSGHCTCCGYNLAGNTSGRCPECGTATHTARVSG